MSFFPEATICERIVDAIFGIVTWPLRFTEPQYPRWARMMAITFYFPWCLTTMWVVFLAFPFMVGMLFEETWRGR